MIFRNPQLLALFILLPALAMLWRWRGGRLPFTALALRLCALGLLIVAMAEPTLGRDLPPTGPLVVLVDQSDSLTPEGKADVQARAARIAQSVRDSAEGPSEPATILWFGANVTPAATAGQPEAEVLDPAASDLAGALRTARELLEPTGGRIVLLSDGMQTTGDALAEAQRAAAAGLAVDVWPVEPAQPPDLRVVRLDAPRSLRVNEDYSVQIVVANTPGPQQDASATQALLRIWEGERLLDEQEVTLEPGDNRFPFRVSAAEPGVMQLRAEVVGTPDTFSRNNSAAATILIEPPPRVLLVEGRADNSRELNLALQREDIQTQVIPAERLPTRLSELDQFDGMVLVDVPVSMLSLDQMTSVREFVRSEGRGLVVAGGRNSFGLGAYKGTPLEEVLPVTMDPPPRPERSDIALLLVVDRSASMTAAFGISKFDMAKEAAILSTESLQSEDSIGILAFDTGQEWTVPFQRIGQGLSLEQIQDAIATIPAGGGTDIFGALLTGLDALARQPASVRHAVLLTDGRSFTNDRNAYRQLIDAARDYNITLSTIAIGQDSDIELLDALAQWGGGRYYFATVPEDIPRLTLLESEIARSDPTVEGQFRADVASTHPLLRGFAPADLPQINGYVATTPKETAEVVLDSSSDDPVLSAWQYGLGRAVAWTPSVSAPWAESWPEWIDFDRFWAQVVRYTLPDAAGGPLQVRLMPQSEGARLVVDAFEVGGAPLDLADVTARVTLPNGTQNDIDLPQVEPGRYARDLLLPDDGPYAVEVTLERDGEQYAAQAGYVQEVPAEYVLPADADSRLHGVSLLQAVAEATGGQVLNDASPIIGLVANSTSPARPPLQLWPWLVGAALMLWVAEIAVRRGVFVRNR